MIHQSGTQLGLHASVSPTENVFIERPLGFRIPYADYEQDGDLLFGEADMGLHQSGIFFAKKF